MKCAIVRDFEVFRLWINGDHAARHSLRGVPSSVATTPGLSPFLDSTACARSWPKPTYMSQEELSLGGLKATDEVDGLTRGPPPLDAGRGGGCPTKLHKK